MDQRARKSPARFLAPLALIAVLVALGVIVSGSGKSGSGKASSPTSASSTTTGTKASGTTTSSTPKTTTTTASGRKTYVVKVGDNLSTIADKTGVTLAKLQELNPAVDPHTMTAGQMIRLR